MPIRVDDRVGSYDLAPLLKRRGLPVELTRLDYGDVCWIGNGPEGPVSVGVELKTVGDLLSCIVSQRFTAHQLPGLQDCYSVRYLVVEGIWKPGATGELLLGKGGGFWHTVSWGCKKWAYREVAHWLSSVEQQGGMCLWDTDDREETAAYIHSIYTWWAKAWTEHKTVRSAHQELKPYPTCNRLALVRPKTPSRLGRMYAQVFGWETGAAVEQKFPRLSDAVAADDATWLKVPGVGKEMLRRWRML